MYKSRDCKNDQGMHERAGEAVGGDEEAVHMCEELEKLWEKL